MAAHIEILDLKLEDQVDHIYTDWEISTTLSFNAVVARSIMDYDNKTSIMFPQSFNPNIKYYARARALLSTGYTTWGNIDVVKPKLINDLLDNEDIPSRISIPIITTNSVTDNHDITLFRINVSGFSNLGTGDHSGTSYFIEKINGEPVWSRINDAVDLTSILVDDVILESNQCYRIKAMFHSSSDDTSQVVSKTIRTSNSSAIELATYLDDINVNNIIPLYINSVEGSTSYEYELLELSRGLVTKLWSTVTPDTFTEVPANVMVEGSVYLLRIRDNFTNIWKYFLFSTQTTEERH